MVKVTPLPPFTLALKRLMPSARVVAVKVWAVAPVALPTICRELPPSLSELVDPIRLVGVVMRLLSSTREPPLDM